jgi:DNA-directed RNA polymerase subunit beta'
MSTYRIFNKPREKEVEQRQIGAIRIGLASPERILEWSHGEVKKPETFNYRTYKPEKDGLFCERIFGPTKDYECACGKYRKLRYKGTVCERCGVEVTNSRVRRERMGHIKLASPVAHIWFTKSIPNRFSALLGINGKEVEKVVYYVNWLIISKDDFFLEQSMPAVYEAVEKRLKELGKEEVSLRDAREVSFFELAKAAPELTPSEKREMTELEKSLEGLKPSAWDDKIHERVEKLIIHVSAYEGLKDHDVRETVKDKTSGEIICVDDENQPQQFTVPLLRKLVSLGHFGMKMENRKRSIDTEKRLEEIKREMRALKSATDLLRAVKRLDRLTDSQHEDIKMLGRLMDMRGIAKLDEHVHIGIGAQAIKEVLASIDLPKLEVELRKDLEGASNQKRLKLVKRLKIVRSFLKSGNKPEWMIMDALPVLPPELRPMVELEGGRFASSDLNDLYRRVINRNNRLKKLIDIHAPESILRNERRMLQEAVDSLIDNGRRGRSAVSVNNRSLKSLSDMLKGKQGRFRQNLLGKRVDYSGRSVIVAGPKLRLYQCGLPKYMALELFKPFVLNRLVDPEDPAQNIATARRMLERADDDRVWDALDEICRAHPVLLNRAPTLHRLSIQAFEPVLIEGKAIQLHPLVCAAYNADFDGDQMAVHVPLATAAQAEARTLMLSANNLFLPADGKPIISPTHDMVLGSYYMTQTRDGKPPHGDDMKSFTSLNEVMIAYANGVIRLHDSIRVLTTIPVMFEDDYVAPPQVHTKPIATTAGRIQLNNALIDLQEELGIAEEVRLPFFNFAMDRGALANVISYAFEKLGQRFTVVLVDALKDLGFEMATQGGVTIGVTDITIPANKKEILDAADEESKEIWSKLRKELITRKEKDEEVTRIWDQATKDMTKAMKDNFAILNPVFMMEESGARGKIDQVRQLAAMRGLLVGPTGRVLDIPIRSNFREGLSVFEYFISTHGGRKGLVDTALKTADSGYLTRRLVDVAVDVSITMDDCGTKESIDVLLHGPRVDTMKRARKALVGRVLAEAVRDPATGEAIAEAGMDITPTLSDRLYHSGQALVKIRSALTCKATKGICGMCYGWDLAAGHMAEIGDPVGVIAAQSIGEPGTQLTMRTFHTGGIKGRDITQGLPYVETLFEVRGAKEPSVLAEREGVVTDITKVSYERVVIQDEEGYSQKAYTILRDEDEKLPIRFRQHINRGDALDPRGETKADIGGIVTQLYTDTKRTFYRVTIEHPDTTNKVYETPHENRQLINKDGQPLRVGDLIERAQPLCEGTLDVKKFHSLVADLKTQAYLVNTIQDIYESQNVNTNSKHIEIIAKQMIKYVELTSRGDSDDHFEGDIMSRGDYEALCQSMKDKGLTPPKARSMLQGISKASLTTDSWLAAASFQETTRVLTRAAIDGQRDDLRGIKENVIIGSLIPVGTGLKQREVRAELRHGSPVTERLLADFFGAEEEAAKALAEEPKDTTIF